MKVAAWLCAAFVSLSALSAQAAGKDDTFPIDQVLGKADAPITIIEYASTTCGHCATFHKQTLPEIKKNWVDTGKAKLIYRDFPTGPAGLSLGASMIAHCAGPDRYFGVLGLIMENQDKWLGSKDPLDTLKKTVRLAGLTGADVDACLQRQDLFEGIQKRAEHAHETFKVDSTPSFLVNGKLVVGALPYAEFNKILTEAAK
ncbi:MAG: DsbA family protein [Magnetospirillum sp.]|nr:DsbA family protein [Magnetospirillum sp.]